MIAFIAIVFVLLVAGAAIGLFLNGRFLSRLRAKHPDIWEELGPPTRFFDDGGSANFSAAREFFRRPELQSRCSADFLRSARLTRNYARAYTLAAVSLLIVILILAWRAGL
jgi:hypothetical protein